MGQFDPVTATCACCGAEQRHDPDGLDYWLPGPLPDGLMVVGDLFFVDEDATPQGTRFVLRRVTAETVGQMGQFRVMAVDADQVVLGPWS